jgi:hypothetical protein
MGASREERRASCLSEVQEPVLEHSASQREETPCLKYSSVNEETWLSDRARLTLVVSQLEFFSAEWKVIKLGLKRSAWFEGGARGTGS